MIVIQFFGGLGNQMFQYALGRYLSIKYNHPIFFDKTIYEENRSNRTFDLDIFKLRANIIDDPAPLNLNPAKIKVYALNEDAFTFEEEVLSVLDEGNGTDIILIISGYWQSHKYFQLIEPVLRNDFTFIKKVTGRWKQLMDNIRSVNSVMINVRRGDYLEKRKMDVHGVVSKEYIEEGMEMYRNTITNPFFFIFSDGMDWCKKHIPATADVFFVDETFYDDKYQFYLQLMVNCKYFIISNSTFSWWAAWLSTYDKKIVISPKRWFATGELDTKDLIPEGWIRL